jgi:tRNA (guanine37-N1)-methyltransferase
MVLRVDVVHKALVAVRTKTKGKGKVVLTSARGTPFNQTKAKEYSKLDSLIILCGHYEGIDERISTYVDEEISIGDFVTTGGEIPAMAITDAVARLIPDVLKVGATENESFSLAHDTSLLLEYPQYTRPETYKGQHVPDVLLSGNHAKIDTWRQEQAVLVTRKRRPDLFGKTE